MDAMYLLIPPKQLCALIKPFVHMTLHWYLFHFFKLAVISVCILTNCTPTWVKEMHVLAYIDNNREIALMSLPTSDCTVNRVDNMWTSETFIIKF